MLMFYLAMLDESEHDAFEKLYTERRKIMKYIAYTILGDEHLAEDIVQDVFLYVN
ncbi:hypothetical protein FACS18949_13960 [Clostridia bacterium]|nr:hypothetical protein FACS189425_09940 [Clostridia bacterium]GHV35626.1 hypothetical protein FACS18949_13960 [Clostridia bacterium]